MCLLACFCARMIKYRWNIFYDLKENAVRSTQTVFTWGKRWLHGLPAMSPSQGNPKRCAHQVPCIRTSKPWTFRDTNVRSRVQSRKLGHVPLSCTRGSVFCVPCCTVLRRVPQSVSLCHAQDVQKQSDKQQWRSPVLLKSAGCCALLLYFSEYYIVTLILAC